MIKRIIVIDIDNCISDDMHRICELPDCVRQYAHLTDPVFEHNEHLQKPRDQLTDEDFHEYHLHCIFDKPKNLDQLYSAGTIIYDEILMVTAMPERYEALRWWWLKEHILPLTMQRIKLLMRPNDSYMPSPQMKVEMLSSYFRATGRSTKEVEIAIDDRQDVLDAYTKTFGFPTKRVFINE